MSGPLVVIDTSEIREGKLDEVKAAIAELADFVEANEAEPIAYNVYVDKKGRRMTVFQIHPSSASMERHMEMAAPLFRKLTGLLTVERVDFYGEPSETLLEQMRQKARLLGDAEVVVNDLHAGFMRVA